MLWSKGAEELQLTMKGTPVLWMQFKCLKIAKDQKKVAFNFPNVVKKIKTSKEAQS